ncbi:MAG: hypothetical protein K1X92_16330 [Bacteroidia bacterium]|nr:hypothetical protein [Bacteroidia bacterium]
MKPLQKFFLLLFLLCCIIFNGVQAQRFFSLTANIKALDIVPVQAIGNDSVNNNTHYKGSSNLLLNARLFTKSGVCLRLGAGMERLQYELHDRTLNTNWESQVQNSKALLGLELHTRLDKEGKYRLYPGVFVPVTFSGKITAKDITNDIVNSFQSKDMQAGIGINLGFNMRFLRIIRLGIEADASLNRAIVAYVDAAYNSYVDVNQLKANLYGTIGISF